MNILNRVIVMIVMAVLFTAALWTLLVTLDAISPDTAPGTFFDDPLQTAADATGGTRALIIAVSVIVALVALVLFFRELIPEREEKTFVVGSHEGGTTALERDSVSRLAEKSAATTKGVRQVHCSADQRQEQVFISCRTTVPMDINVEETRREIQDKVRHSVQEHTGLPVGDVNIRLKYEDTSARRMNVS